LLAAAKRLDGVERMGHLVLVDNPAHHPRGDFSLDDHGLVRPEPALTFAGIAVYHPAYFAGLTAHQPAKLLPQLLAGMEKRQLSGEHYQGLWIDVGTVERLAEADAIARGW
jgi:MurNAc alpha-1-phosphate uridylyltransferase